MSNSLKKPGNPFAHHKLPFSLRLFFASWQIIFKLMGLVSPKLAGKVALRFFMTPFKFKTPKKEIKLRETAEQQTHNILGNQIMVYCWGAGPVVLLSHGWAGRGTQFSEFVQPLVNAGYRVVAVDAPVHGLSSGKRTNMLDVSNTLAKVAEQYGPIKAMIGHSFGAGTALLGIERSRIAVDKLILISSVSSVMWVSEQFGKVFDLSDKNLQAMRDEAEKRYSNAFETPWKWHQLSPVNTIKNISAEILLLHDKQDNEVPFQHFLELHEVVPEAETSISDGLGHRRILKSSDVIQRCIDFIER